MQMKLAVYTAQEGYAWQPGTALTEDDLVRFKRQIGRFPSPDAPDFPFGGIFRLEDRVVFYRYHVAKKIDFCGRDALYCVLGAVSCEEAAKIDPAALFALPAFAGPMKPFPVSTEVPEADPSAVPEWLKNLDGMTLDARIDGPAENPRYAVKQGPVETPKPDAGEVGTPDATLSAAIQAPTGAEAPAVPDGDAQPAPPVQRSRMPRYAVVLGILALAALVVAAILSLKGKRAGESGTSDPTQAAATNTDASAASVSLRNTATTVTAVTNPPPATTVPPISKQSPRECK